MKCEAGVSLRIMCSLRERHYTVRVSMLGIAAESQARGIACTENVMVEIAAGNTVAILRDSYLHLNQVDDTTVIILWGKGERSESTRHGESAYALLEKLAVRTEQGLIVRYNICTSV